MMNMFRRLRYKKGFTLTELIVATAIIALLMTCVALFAQPVRTMISGVEHESDSLKICEIVGNYLERRIAYADMVDVFVGYDKNDADVKEKFKELINDHTTSPVSPPTKRDAQYTKGMLLFAFEKNTDEAEKSTFVLYDIPIKDTDTAIPSDISKYKVFTDEFYDRYEMFITTDEKMNGTYYTNVNNLTHNAFFSFRILAYEFNNAGTGITEKIVKDYYKYINSGSGSDPTDAIISSRTGIENVSFTFENIRMGVNAKGIYNNYVDTSNVLINRADGDSVNTDTIIFYAVKNYKSSDITVPV